MLHSCSWHGRQPHMRECCVHCRSSELRIGRRGSIGDISLRSLHLWQCLSLHLHSDLGYMSLMRHVCVL